MRIRFFAFSLFLISLLSVDFVNGQKGIGVGASALYNTKNGYVGTGARVLIPVREKLWAVPFAYYYFSDNSFNGGIAAMVPFYNYRSLTFYAIACGTFRGSVSVSASTSDTTAAADKSYQADGEIGAGVLIGPGCLKGFVEPRYAILNKEVLLRAGVIYFFGCGKGKGKGGGKGRKRGPQGGGKWPGSTRKAPCPAYY